MRLLELFRTRRLRRDFDEELESHVRLLTDENIRGGMSPDEAHRAARIRVGNLSSLKEQHRDVRGLPAVDTIMKDVRFAFRLIARNRWFSAAVIVALALGIGVNATGFTVVNAAFRAPVRRCVHGVVAIAVG